MAANTTRVLVFNELSDFWLSQPDLETILEYRLPEAMQQRLHELLLKNREIGLSADEREEMNHFMAADHFMTLLKAKARLKLQKHP